MNYTKHPPSILIYQILINVITIIYIFIHGCMYLIYVYGCNVGEQLVNLNSLVLTNNKISDFSEIDNLATCKKLEYLSLVDNPVIHKLYYRLYTIYKIPSLRVLDYQKVKKSERDAATTFFATEVKQSLINNMQNIR